MSEAPLSIAVPFYRGLDYLRDALASVVEQEDPHWRCIVHDDRGEAEGVGELVASFADARLSWQRNERNLGIVGNWNRCLEVAPTDLVTLLHADDRLRPGYVGLVRGLAAAHPDAAAFFCAAEIIGADGRPGFSFADLVKRFLVPRGGDPFAMRGEPALRALMRGDFVMCPTLCYRKSVLGARRFDARWRQVQDLDLLTRLLLEDEVLVGSRQRAYAYRRHDRSLTAEQSESLLRFEEELALFDLVAEAAEALGWSRAARTARRKAIVKLHLAYRVTADLLGLRPAAARRKWRFLLGRGHGRTR